MDARCEEGYEYIFLTIRVVKVYRLLHSGLEVGDSDVDLDGAGAFEHGCVWSLLANMETHVISVMDLYAVCEVCCATRRYCGPNAEIRGQLLFWVGKRWHFGHNAASCGHLNWLRVPAEP